MKLLFLQINFILLLLNTQISGKDYSIHYLSTEMGLSQNEVTAIIQDQKGYMWFGTRGGLNRFDGYEFTQFKSRPNDAQGLSNPSVECVFKALDGKIWIGTKSGGIDIYQPKTSDFIHLDNSENSLIQLSGFRIITISQSSDSLMLLGSWLNGLTIWDIKTDSVDYLLPGHKVSCIQEENNGTLWIGTNHGLYEYNVNTKHLEHHNFQNEYFNINEFFLDENQGVIWIASWQNGLVRYNPKTKKYICYRIKAESEVKNICAQNTYSLMSTEQGQIYVGTWGGGLHLFDPEHETFKPISIKPENLGELNNDFDIILELYKSSGDEIWVGTDGGGICRIGAHPAFDGVFLSNKKGSELSNYHILSILNTNENQLWIGTKGGGLYYTNDREKYFAINNLDNETNFEQSIIMCLFQDSQNQIWVGSNLGLQKIEKQGTKYDLINFDREDKWWNIRKVSAIYKSDQAFLVGTQQNGLFDIFETLQNDTVVKNYLPENNSVLKNRRITFIKKDSHSRIWVGTYNGIYFYDIEKKEFKEINLHQNSAFSSQIILSWVQKNDSIYFIGTPSGLTQLTEEKNNLFVTTNYYKEDGLPDDFIHSLLVDSDENLWISTNQGISRFNPEILSFRNYDEHDGMQGNSFSEGCSFASDNNELFFGGINGFNFFNPKKIVDITIIPKMILTGFKIENKPIKTGDKIYKRQILNQDISYTSKISLPYQVNQFSLTFAALCFNASDRNNYAYRLTDLNNNWVEDQNNNWVEDQNNSWINIGNKRTVSFNKLRAGTYIFEVIGSNIHNVWNKDPLQLEIKVYPAPWRSWWASVIYIILVVAIILVILWVAGRQSSLLHQIEIESLRVDKEKELSEAKLRFFTNISHEFRTPLTLIMGPLHDILNKEKLSDKVKSRLQIIFENANRLLSLVHQLLDFRRIENSEIKVSVAENDIVQFVRHSVRSFESLAEINQITLNFSTEWGQKKIWFDAEKLEMVLNNLLSNAFKFAGTPGTIGVAVKKGIDEALIEVSDSGPGIPQHEIDKIFDRFYQADNVHKRVHGSSGIGLALAKRIVELHGGTIEVKSVPNEKTNFGVRLKFGKEHFSESQIIEQSSFPIIVDKGSIVTAPRHKIKPPAKKGSESFLVLIVEDHEDVRNYLVDLLSADYEIIEAEDGAVGYKKCLINFPDLVISDVMMPVSNGFEMCRKIKQNQVISHIPVLLLTAKEADQFQIEGMTAGADSYISKPFNPDFLVTKVASLLKKQQRLHKYFSKKIRLEPTDVEITPNEEKILKDAISLVEQNLDSPDFTTEKMAEQMNMSSSTLYRKLKAVSGMSTNVFIRSIRLKRAAQLLSDSSKSIVEISDEVGISDIKYFRKCFKDQFGMPPSDYRKVADI